MSQMPKEPTPTAWLFEYNDWDVWKKGADVSKPDRVSARNIEPLYSQQDLDAMLAYAESLENNSVPYSDIRKAIAHIKDNAKSLKKFGGSSVDEARCRQLCAMYLEEWINSHEMKKKLTAIDAARKEQA